MNATGTLAEAGRDAAAASNSLALVVRCYEAVIADLREARRLTQSVQTEEAFEKIRHAQDLLTELLIGLDYERGGEIAQNLARIYNFVLRRLIFLNTSESTESYDHLIHILEELKGAWQQLMLVK